MEHLKITRSGMMPNFIDKRIDDIQLDSKLAIEVKNKKHSGA